VTDSERFYGSVIEAFTEPLYQSRVKQLLSWWDACALFLLLLPIFQLTTSTRQIFPVYTDRSKHPKKGSVLALMRAQIMNEEARRLDDTHARETEDLTR
jgi:hypothetical protein